jgi:hypothetical protein
MSTAITKLYYSFWMPLKKWANQTFGKGKDDDNNPFDTPFAIL